MAAARKKVGEVKEKDMESNTEEEKLKEKEEKCRHCWKEVRGDGVQCEICCGWFHYICVNIPQLNTSSKVLANEGVHYFCKWCNNTAETIIPMIKELKERQEKIEKEIVEIHEWQDKMENELAMDKKVQSEQEKIIEEIKKRQEKVENKMEETRVNLEEWEAKVESAVDNIQKRVGDYERSMQDFNEKMQELYASKADDSKVEDIKRTYAGVTNNAKVEEVLQNFRDRLDEDKELAKKMLEETKERIQNEKERETRKNNIVVYRVEENASSSSEDRQKYDRQYAKDLVRTLKIPCGDEDIGRVIRLGAKGSTDRPLLIEFKSIIMKYQVMESLSLLQDAENRFRSVSISHDMTKSERMQCKEAVVKAKEKRAADQSGEFKYLVRGVPGNMRVVKVRKIDRD